MGTFGKTHQCDILQFRSVMETSEVARGQQDSLESGHSHKDLSAFVDGVKPGPGGRSPRGQALAWHVLGTWREHECRGKKDVARDAMGRGQEGPCRGSFHSEEEERPRRVLSGEKAG